MYIEIGYKNAYTYTRSTNIGNFDLVYVTTTMKKKEILKIIEKVSDEAEIRVHIFTKHRMLPRPIAKVWVADILKDYEDAIIIEVEK